MNYNYIKQLREILSVTGWPQERLAGEIGVTFAALNRWINKRAVPHKTAQKLIYNLYKEKVGILPVDVSALNILFGRIDANRKKYKNVVEVFRDNQNVRDEFLLELTYNSDAIEGSTLTKKETEAVIFDKSKIENRTLIEHLEASNHAAVLERIFNGECNDVINEDLLKGLHRAIMQGIRHDAGMYSKFHRAIRGVDLIMPAPEDIQEEMDVLFKVINYKEKKTNTGCEGLIAHVAKMHASFEAIHPFGDGNGRIGRLIMIIQLLSEGYAPCVVENSCKGEYYEVLEYAQKRSETALIKFVAEAVLKGYKLLEKYEGR